MKQLLRLPLATIFLAVLPTLSGDSLNQHEIPQLSDDRLQITLYAADPDIVTPIGGTVGPDGRFYVIECHTHSPPQNYTGPDRDLIKAFSGERSDGTFESMSVVADDLFQAQALAFAPDRALYIVCTREVLQLHDRDGDGHFESRTRILRLDPYEKRGNPHGQMMGIAFSNDGWLYTATGTTIDDWIDRSGKRLEVGPYWGGIIARCRPDGTQLERVAWGFWNPFSLIFDQRGRLLTVDNDPDHRAPNRLLHIVQGGDYGYKKTYGRYGLHPYQAWEGELPGTLPMIAGIGEAPTAVMSSNAAALPSDYQDTIIGAAWGEHNLTLFRTEPEGASLKATSEILVQGRGHDDFVSPFRPSGLAASPVDGAIYVSDWMLIDYTTHKRGRIWKISAKAGIETHPPRQPFERQEPTPELARMRALAETRGSGNYPALLEAAMDEDPFIRNAALNAAIQPEFRESVIRDLNHPDAKIRLASLLTLRRADVANPEIHIRPRLLDPDQSVARMAMQWAGEKELRFLTEAIGEAASKPGMDEAFFQTWLATMQILQNPIVVSPDDETPSYRRQRKIDPGFIEQLAHDTNQPAILRALSLRLLQNLESPGNHRLLKMSALGPDSELSVEAIRRLADSPHPESQSILLQLARDQAKDTSIRTEAIAALAGKPDPSLASLLDDPEPDIQLEAARSLRGLIETTNVVAKVSQELNELQESSGRNRLRSQLEFLAGTEKRSRPNTLEGWQRLLETGGDPEAGRRVFFSPQLACISCHTAEGRGHKLGTGYGAGFMALPLGPDLSHIGAAASRDVLIHSIVRPSDTIAPEYQGWFVNLKDGSSHYGREIDQERNGVQMVMLDGNERSYPNDEIDTWGAMEHSLMPDGLPESMSIEEFRDLIAYLENLK